MILSAITVDQLRVFRQVVETGSFSAAARAMHRAQSAVTYAVQKLEEQVGVPLFDRSGYRPVLSEAGRALLPRATRILEELTAFSTQARAIAGGLEPEVSVVVDPLFPMERFVEALADFQREFPPVQLRVYVETMGASVQAVLDGRADLALTIDFAAADSADLEIVPVDTFELVPVAAPSHPLARAKKITAEMLRDHVQLVLTDRSPVTKGKDYGVYAVRTWRLADLGARHELLRAGLGWGNMPLHMVADDLKAKRLVRLDIRRPGGAWKPAVVLARRKGKVLGPAGQWLAKRFAEKPRKGKGPR
jgi:DNA-binding transcriptional LysR family regulator